MSFFSKIQDNVREFFAGVPALVWYGGAALLLLVTAVVVLSRLPSSADPNVVQLTVNAAATTDNLLFPTIAGNLSQTPPQAALTGAAPTLALEGRRLVQQYAASALSPEERDRIAQGAVQAVGPPNTDGCGDFRTAWATANPNSTGTLELYFAELVRPRAVRVYETYNPGFITLIEFIDVEGVVHPVYVAAPQARPQCPFILDVPIPDIDEPGNRIKIYVDQTTSAGGWNQIDAVELVGVKY